MTKYFQTRLILFQKSFCSVKVFSSSYRSIFDELQNIRKDISIVRLIENADYYDDLFGKEKVMSIPKDIAVTLIEY